MLWVQAFQKLRLRYGNEVINKKVHETTPPDSYPNVFSCNQFQSLEKYIFLWFLLLSISEFNFYLIDGAVKNIVSFSTSNALTGISMYFKLLYTYSNWKNIIKYYISTYCYVTKNVSLPKTLLFGNSYLWIFFIYNVQYTLHVYMIVFGFWFW